MTWTTSKTFVAGDVLTAADLNTYLRDNTTQLYNDLALATAGLTKSMQMVGEDLTEHTVHSAGYTDMVTVTATVAAAATTEIIIIVPFRKTAGAAASASLLVTVTTSGGTTTGGVSPVTDAVNLAGSGLMIMRCPPRYTNYVNAGYVTAVFAGSTEVKSYAATTQRQTGTLTSVKIQGLTGSTSVDVGVQGVKVYANP